MYTSNTPTDYGNFRTRPGSRLVPECFVLTARARAIVDKEFDAHLALYSRAFGPYIELTLIITHLTLLPLCQLLLVRLGGYIVNL
jgi:hypothetical protein